MLVVRTEVPPSEEEGTSSVSVPQPTTWQNRSVFIVNAKDVTRVSHHQRDEQHSRQAF